jgi:GR25 family glycosyltransferase involved in LPS biosynthesis
MIIIQEYFESSDNTRLEEIRKVLDLNLNNKNITKIYLINEKIYPYVDNLSLQYPSRLQQVTNNKRLTFKDAVLFANKFIGEIVVISNNDISFDVPENNIISFSKQGNVSDISFENIQRITADNPKNVITLTRWEMDNHYKITESWPQGQDMWAFKSPLIIDNINDLDFYFGKLSCDTVFAGILKKNGYNCINCPRNIVTVHHHLSQYRTYSNNDAIATNEGYVPEFQKYGNLPYIKDQAENFSENSILGDKENIGYKENSKIYYVTAIVTALLIISVIRRIYNLFIGCCAILVLLVMLGLIEHYTGFIELFGEVVDPLAYSEVYVISLSDNIYTKAVENLRKTGLKNIKKFDAIKGSSLKDFIRDPKNVSIKGHYDVSIPNNRSAHSDLGTLNAIGCYLSHVKLWEKIVDENLPGMFIFESDAVCKTKLFEYTKQFLNTKNPHVLFFGYLFTIVNAKNKIPGTSLVKLDKRMYGLHAYYITYAGAKALLKNVFPVEEQLDSYISDLLLLSLEPNSAIEPLNIYLTTENICVQDNIEGTSIQTKSVKYGTTY